MAKLYIAYVPGNGLTDFPEEEWDVAWDTEFFLFRDKKDPEAEVVQMSNMDVKLIESEAKMVVKSWHEGAEMMVDPRTFIWRDSLPEQLKPILDEVQVSDKRS